MCETKILHWIAVLETAVKYQTVCIHEKSETGSNYSFSAIGGGRASLRELSVMFRLFQQTPLGGVHAS